MLPHLEEPHCVLVLQPLLDESAAAVEVLHHVGKRDEVIIAPARAPSGRVASSHLRPEHLLWIETLFQFVVMPKIDDAIVLQPSDHDSWCHANPVCEVVDDGRGQA